MLAVTSVGKFDTAAWALVIVSSGLLIATAVYAWYARKQANMMRNNLELETAPNVVAYLDIDHRGMAHLVVQNIGKGIAQDIKVHIEPPLMTSKDFDPMNMTILKEGIRSLVPGQTIRALIDFERDYFKAKLPDKYTATLTFSGPGQSRRNNVCPVDFYIYRNLWEAPLKTVHELVQAIEKLAK
jgi:hypothetical protein